MQAVTAGILVEARKPVLFSRAVLMFETALHEVCEKGLEVPASAYIRAAAHTTSNAVARYSRAPVGHTGDLAGKA